ncbi:MAG: preprotein translocase subunit TatC [Desulfobulbaceae bacterium A2]|nr:MAG: preprotein translocase subunit TatC [Desulfobulbaceae bacterium A2]
MEPYQRLVLFLGELRRSSRRFALVLVLATLVCTLAAPWLLRGLQGHLAEKLYFFAVADPFLAHVKLAFFTALFVLVPWLLLLVWRGLGRAFGLAVGSLGWFVAGNSLLFYLGIGFCLFLTLPYGIKFLLGFQSAQLTPVISIGRFVDFVLFFLLAFGLIFQVPMLMLFCARVGVSHTFFSRNRRYAVLAISIIAALLTPTPDLVNMALMGGPLYLLYELGILLMRWGSRGRSAA